MDPYTFQTKEFEKVPGHRPTEPGLQANFEAIRERDFREETQHSDDEYLESIKNELQQRSRSFKFQIYEIGKLLYEAKQQLPHGEFKPWVESNFEHGYRTAHNCMKVYLACMGNPEVVEYFNPSCLYIISKPSFPDDLREALFDNVKGPAEVDKKELIELSMKYKNGEISTEDEEVQRVLKTQRDKSIWEKYKIELEALEMLVNQRAEKIENVSKINPNNPLIDDNEQESGEEEVSAQLEDTLNSIRAQIRTLIDALEEKMNLFHK